MGWVIAGPNADRKPAIQVPESKSRNPDTGLEGAHTWTFQQGVFRCGALSTSSSSAFTEQGLGQGASLYRENTASMALCPHQTSVEGDSITILPALLFVFCQFHSLHTSYLCRSDQVSLSVCPAISLFVSPCCQAQGRQA